MSLYDEINSFATDDNLKKLLELHFTKKIGYDKVIIQDSNIKDIGEELNVFKDEILFPAASLLIESIKSVDSNAFNSTVEECIKNSNMDEIDASEFRNRNLFPLEEYQKMFNKYSLSELIEIYYKVRNNSEVTFANFQTQYKNNSSNEENKIFKLMSNFIKYFRGGAGVMGFHINPSKLSICNVNIPTVKSEIKFYINAGADSYKIAKLFWDKCSEKGYNYYFKVVQPKLDAGGRVDKLCIFCELKDAEKYIEILKEIIKEHPEFNYQKPPILCGTVDGIIGVGTDSSKGSYTNDILKSINEAVKRTLKECPNLKNKESINTYYIQIFRKNLKEVLKNNGRDPEKMCLNSKVSDYLKNKQIKGINMNLHESEKIDSRYFVENIDSLSLLGEVSMNILENSKVEQFKKDFFGKIPECGYFIMKEHTENIYDLGYRVTNQGLKISAMQFIKNYGRLIIKDYNGNYNKFIEERTIPNNGKIYINDKLQDATNIINYFDDSLLNYVFEYKENKITIREFIINHVIKNLPECGYVILNDANKTKIDIINFVKLLLKVFINREAIDVKDYVFRSTKANDGKITLINEPVIYEDDSKNNIMKKTT